MIFCFSRKITIDNGIEKSFETEQSSELENYTTLEAEKENPGRSRHELEMALHKRSLSRPGSRQVLTSIDMNSKSSTKNVDKSFLSPVKEKLTQSYIGSGEKPRMVLGKLGEESTTGTCCTAKVRLGIILDSGVYIFSKKQYNLPYLSEILFFPPQKLFMLF